MEASQNTYGPPVWWVDPHEHTARPASDRFEKPGHMVEMIPKLEFDQVLVKLTQCIDLLRKNDLALGHGGSDSGKNETRTIGLENLALRGWP